MTNAQATRRYFGVLIPGAIAFLGLSYGLKLAEDAAVPSAVLYAAALLPIVVLVGAFWAHWRYMKEIDEFLRSIQVKAAFVAFTIVLAIATGWGYLELYAELPTLSMYWLNPLYWVAYAVAAVVFTLRSGGTS